MVRNTSRCCCNLRASGFIRPEGIKTAGHGRMLLSGGSNGIAAKESHHSLDGMGNRLFPHRAAIAGEVTTPRYSPFRTAAEGEPDSTHRLINTAAIGSGDARDRDTVIRAAAGDRALRHGGDHRPAGRAPLIEEPAVNPQYFTFGGV